jgi:dipeptidyl aminopeptidase/acylaminoacyl peptidase
VLFLKERILMAQRLDLKTFQLAEEAFPIAEPVGTYLNYVATFSVSDNGVLVYGSGVGGDRQLTWFDRAGKLLERIGPSMPIFDVVLSPDQKRAAIQYANNDIWVVDLARRIPSRLTFNMSIEDYPVWSPDGTRVLFNSTANGAPDMYWKMSSGAGNDEVVLKSGAAKRPTDWSRDGRYILYESDDAKNRSDIWVLPVSGDRKPEVFLQTPFDERNAHFSPDGKWVAYVSDESGSYEVYVQSFPPSGGKWQISTNGGISMRWRADGKELFYLSPDRRVESVEVKAVGATFEIGSPRTLFEAPVDAAAVIATNRFDVSPDGQRFLVNAPAENTTSAAPMTVVVNWLASVGKGK